MTSALIKRDRLRLQIYEGGQILSIDYDLGDGDSLNADLKRSGAGWNVAVTYSIKRLTKSGRNAMRGVVAALLATLGETVGPHHATGDSEAMFESLKRVMDTLHDYFVNELFA